MFPLYGNQSVDIHREKNTLKLNFTAYEKYEYEHLGRWYIKLTLFKRC